MLVNETSNPLNGRVAIHEKHWLAKLTERFNKRVVASQNHLVIDLSVDPALHQMLDVTKITHHASLIESCRSDFHLGNGVVAMWMLAHSVIIEQAMPVTKTHTLDDGIHGRPQ